MAVTPIHQTDNVGFIMSRSRSGATDFSPKAKAKCCHLYSTVDCKAFSNDFFKSALFFYIIVGHSIDTDFRSFVREMEQKIPPFF